MPSTEQIREIQVLMGGRGTKNVANEVLFAPNGPPSSATAGYELTTEKPILALIGATLKEIPTEFEGWASIDDAVVAASYGYIYNGVGYSYSAQVGDTKEAIAIALASLLPEAVAMGDKIRFKSDTTFTLAPNLIGAGAVRASLAATLYSYQLWMYAKGRGWHRIPDSLRQDIDASELERFVISGGERLYLEFLSADGAYRPLFQPAGLIDA